MSEIPRITSFEEFEAATLPILFPPYRSQFRARWFHEISGEKPKRNWLSKNLLLARSFGIVFGPPGCGKSFLISDFALSAALAAITPEKAWAEWFGHKVKPFGTIYIAAEGSDDFEVRLHAWRMHHGVPVDAVLPFVFLPTSVDLRSNDVDLNRLIEECRALSAQMKERCGVEAEMIVIDTVARALAGGNENASDVMGAFVINCGKLQESLNQAAIGVHHGGKEGGRGPRGHEALHGAADLEIEVAGASDGMPNAWTVRKQKAGPAGATHKFRLRPMTVSYDDDDDAITSCVVVPESATDAVVKRKADGFRANQTEMEFLQVMCSAIEKKGVMPPPGLSVPAKVTLLVPIADIKQAYWDKLSGSEDGDEDHVKAKLRQRWSRATRSLMRFNVIGSAKPWMWMTGKLVQGLSLRGVATDPEVAAPVTNRDENDEDPAW